MSPWDGALLGAVMLSLVALEDCFQGFLFTSDAQRHPAAAMGPHPYQADCLQQLQLAALITTCLFSALWPQTLWQVALAMCSH